LNSPLLGLTTIIFPSRFYLIYVSFVAAAVDSCEEKMSLGGAGSEFPVP